MPDAGDLDALAPYDSAVQDTSSPPDISSAADISSAPDAARPDGGLVASDAGLTAVWWDSAYGARQLIRLVNTSTESLSDFPVLVRVSEGCLDLSALRADRGDLRFVVEGGTEALAYEVDTSNAEQLLVWVKVPTVAAEDETRLWLYHANPDAQPAEDPAAVWSNGYRAVWHMGHSIEPAVLTDSSAHANGAIISESLPRVAGVAGDGRLFQFDVVEAPHDVSLDMAADQALTLEGWAKPDLIEADGRYIIRRHLGYHLAAMRSYTAALSPELLVWMDLGGSTDSAGGNAGAPLSTTGYTYVVGSYAAGDHTIRVYLDGALANQRTLGASFDPWTLRTSTEVLKLGDQYNGRLDELRVSAVVRSDAWIQAQYDVMAGSFVTLDRCDSQW